MDIKELDKLAKNNEPMPSSGLQLYEQAYYQASRFLYKAYYDKQLTLEQCREEKQQIIQQYEWNKNLVALFFKLYEIKEQLEKQGNPLALEKINRFMEE